MAKVIIVSKTRMANNNVCVGGVDIDNKRSIRLLDENGYRESQDECPYEIWDVWNINYHSSSQRPAPHTEDVNVFGRSKMGALKTDLRDATEFAKLLQRANVHVFSGGLLNCFDGKLKCTQYGTLYINEDDVPNYSTCFWMCDRPINRSDFKGKVRYNYNNGSRNWGYNISYVGLSAPQDIIPKGSLVRLSLAHWWSPSDSDDEERCYLQLSGYIMESKRVETTICLPVSEALKGYDPKLVESSKCYENTNIHILWLSLDKTFQGQDFLVLSENAAAAIHNCKDADEQRTLLSNCIVIYSEESKCYGIILRHTKI